MYSIVQAVIWGGGSGEGSSPAAKWIAMWAAKRVPESTQDCLGSRRLARLRATFNLQRERYKERLKSWRMTYGTRCLAVFYPVIIPGTVHSFVWDDKPSENTSSRNIDSDPSRIVIGRLVAMLASDLLVCAFWPGRDLWPGAYRFLPLASWGCVVRVLHPSKAFLGYGGVLIRSEGSGLRLFSAAQLLHSCLDLIGEQAHRSKTGQDEHTPPDSIVCSHLRYHVRGSWASRGSQPGI